MAKASTTAKSEGSVRIVDRIVDLLTVLEKAEQPIGLAEISRASAIHKATAQRLLTALERREFVHKDRGFYQLGSGILPLARAFLSGNRLGKSALPVLEELAANTGETASIYVRQAMERVIVQRVESPSPLRFVVRIGERLPIYSGSTGQVFCASMPREEIEKLLERIGDIRYANGTVLNKKKMLARLDQVRSRGFAVSIDERLLGITSVAAPVVHPETGVIAAVVVTGPSSRLTSDRIPQISDEVQHAAREIAERYCRG
jgi:IclR family acetate operon transcriptional repressor